MAGHSKWSIVKRINGAMGVNRRELFWKLSKAITVAAGMDGVDPFRGMSRPAAA